MYLRNPKLSVWLELNEKGTREGNEVEGVNMKLIILCIILCNKIVKHFHKNFKILNTNRFLIDDAL